MKKLFLITIIALGTIKLQAQTLKELVSSSVTNYPKLKELQANVALADEKVALAKSGYQPNIAINGSYNYLAPISKVTLPIPGMSGDIQFMPNHNYNANLSVQQTVWDFGRTNANVQKAKNDKTQIADNLKANELNLAYQVAMIYNNIVLLNKNITLQDEQIKFAQDNFKLITNKIKNGDALGFDSLNANVRVKIAQNRKVDLVNQLEKQLNLLRFYTGNQAANVTAQRFEGNAIASIYPALEHNADVLLANDKVLAAEKDYKTSVANFLPNLFVNGSAGWKNAYMPNINDMRFNYVVGAGLTIPLYDGGRAVAQRKITKIAIDAAKQNLSYAQQNANKDLLQAQADLNANKIRLENTRAIAQQAEAAFSLAQSRYKNGTLTWLDLENARINVEDTRFSLIQLDYQIALNYLEVDRLSGIRFWEK